MTRPGYNAGSDVGVEPALQPVKYESLPLLPIEKMMPVLMLPGTVGVGIGSVHFLMPGCLILLRTPIFVPRYYQFHKHEK